MKANDIINVIQKNANINLSTKERNWIKDNVAKLQLHVDFDNLFIPFNEIDSRFH